MRPPSFSAFFAASRVSRGALATVSAVLAVALAFGTEPRSARAQSIPSELGVPRPARPLAANDQASATATNPANLAFLPAAELRWTWMNSGPASMLPARGHAFDLAFPLPARLATGFSLELVRPPEAAPQPFHEAYARFAWGLALRTSDAFSIGFSLRHLYANDPRVAGATGLDLATTIRPNPYGAIAVVAHDVNQSLTSSGWQLGHSFDFGLTLRPTGRRDVELSIQARYLPEPLLSRPFDPLASRDAHWIPGGVVGIDVPHIGRLRGEVTITDPTSDGPLSYTATAGIELAGVEGGALFGSGLGGADGAGFYMGLGISGRRNPPSLFDYPSTYALKIRIEQTPGARAHAHLLRRLWRLSRDEQVGAVVLELKAEPADSLAHAEELGDAIRMLRAAGKKVLCHLEDAAGRSLYVCAQADRTFVNPAGGIRFAGLRSQYMYYAGLFDKLGVRAQFVRIGAHKTAPEAFTQQGPSDVARADYLDLLHENEDVFLNDVGGGRRIAVNRLRDIIAKGPFIASEAKTAGLVDEFAFDDEIGHMVSETVGRKLKVLDEAPPARVPSRFGRAPHIAVVFVEGDMVDGRSKHIPLLGTTLVGSYTIGDAIKQAREDSLVRAVVLRVESPGGSSMAADVIWREVVLTAKVKPVIVSMGTYAASGGYYIAAAGTEIFANPLTVTGSIGIFYGKADVSELLDKVGIHVETLRTAPHADAESMYRPFTPEEITLLQQKVGQFYDVFLDRVAQGRHMTKAQVDAVGQGHVWTGREALARGLVDHLGGLRDAIDRARHLTGLPLDTPIEELPVPEQSLLDAALHLAGVEAEADSETPPTAILPPALVAAARAAAPFMVYTPDRPLAHIEWVPVDEP